ncbi:MAG: phospho-N-acetylmuramoyl-pentapeptide-transferase [Clostridia bacterium]|nr:phospho-N-acetylmuramoyl-pentapeptide-transferase [Clostridia bacterium]
MNNMNMILMGLLPAICAFAVTALTGPVFIPWLRKLKFGQEIREEGPAWHQKKSGTPTMGGLMFMLGITVAVAAVFLVSVLAGNGEGDVAKSVLILAVALGFGAIGFVDDFIKVVKKRNLGLKALPKFLLQMLITVVYLGILMLTGDLSAEIAIPFTDFSLSMPMWLYFIFVMFVVTGTVNAVNLTDGIDGLASSVTVPVVILFALCGWRMGEAGIYSFGLAVAGGLAGFLLFNKHPAKVFMGDTGSLFLGGAVVAIAVALQMHLYLIIAGFVYFAETLSVILQVASFKLTGKRIFKMTPIHHHFEMCEWNEVKIVTVFTAVTVILCAVSYFV